MSINTVVTLSIVLFAASLTSVANSAVLAPKSNLVLLGKFSQLVTEGDQQGTLQTSYYFLSQNAAGWATAASDCRASLGDTSALLNIETAEELAEVKRIFENSDDTGSTYWTGGTNDVDSSAFVWTSSGEEIDSSTPWDAGHPNTRTSVTRVLAYTVGGLKFRTDFATVSLRYICELVV